MMEVENQEGKKKDELRRIRLPFTQIENEVLLNPNISIYEKIIYSVLCCHAGSRKSCFPSLRTLQRETGIKKRNKVIECINNLQKIGLIKKLQSKFEGTNGHRTNVYEITGVVTVDYQMVTKSYKGGNRGLPEVVTMGYLNNINTTIRMNNTNDHSDNDMNETVFSNHKNNGYEKKFDIWWEIYPRKVAKKAAMKKFLALKPDDVLFEKMMSGLEALIEDKRGPHGELDLKFFPHPTTWLNQERWEDEIPKKEKKWNEF